MYTHITEDRKKGSSNKSQPNRTLHTQYHWEFHSTDYFLERREFCTHHERLSLTICLNAVYFLSMNFFGHFLLTSFFFRTFSRFCCCCCIVAMSPCHRCDFHFRLLKVYRTHYFRLICSMLIYQRRKR